MRRRQVQNRYWQCSLRRLRDRNVLNNHRRDGCRDLRYVPRRQDFAQRKHVQCCVLYPRLQRRVHRPERRPVHRLCRRQVQKRDR